MAAAVAAHDTSATGGSGTRSILDLVGGTPLLDLSPWAWGEGVPRAVRVQAKAEWFNPGGSVKARAAAWIFRDALQSGALAKERCLIDSSSGNTAISYAQIGAALGYRVKLVMPANVSIERKTMVQAYGAELIESDPLEGSDGAIRVVRQLVAEDPSLFHADQYANPANWLAHYETTGPEIWQQTEGRVTHFVCGLGTTGTFVGVGRYLREQDPDIRLVSVQPSDELSVIEGLKHLPTSIVPPIYDPGVATSEMTVDPEASWDLARRLAREQGIFMGLSAGGAVAAALDVARELERGVVVTILPDDGSKYVSLGVFD